MYIIQNVLQIDQTEKPANRPTEIGSVHEFLEFYD